MNISITQIEVQLENFKHGFPFADLTAAAIPENGIMVLDEASINDHLQTFKNEAEKYRIIKMVPASGAASRMFKSLYAFMDCNEDKPAEDVKEFLDRIKDFAFYDELKRVMNNDGYKIEESDPGMIIEYLLTEKGLGYTSLPKGLLLFHNYDEGPRTPL